MDDDIAIRVDRVSKQFKLPREKNSSIKSAFINFYRRNRSYEMLEALKNVSLEVKKGEFFGIVGRNGSGKSTLLKLLAGIYVPSDGSVTVNGKLTPFIELGVGFNPELTGRENVFLNGALLGFNRREMKKMYQDIVDFAEIEKFMDQKLKNYSSGMQVRLAFSIAIRAESDILLIDEVLAVGDTNFQRKCFDYFEKLKKDRQTIIFISHDMSSIKRFCNRAALLHNGQLKFIGDAEKVADLYEKQNAQDIKLFEKDAEVSAGAVITKMAIKNHKSKGYGKNDEVTLNIIIEAEKDLKIIPGVNIHREDGQFVAGVTSHAQIEPKTLKPHGAVSYNFSFMADQLTPGNYFVDGVIYEPERNDPIFFKSSMTTFRVLDVESGWGALNLKGIWGSSKDG